MRKLLFFAILLILFCGQIYSQNYVYINKIDVIRKDVGDGDSSFLGRLLTTLHFKTLEYVIKDELIFSENSETGIDFFDETERNLRALGIFTNVQIELDSIGFNQYNAIVTTQDSWSTYLLPNFNSSLGYNNYGLDFDEYNLLGTGSRLQLKWLYRQESNIGRQGSILLFNQRIPGTDFQDSLYIKSNKIRTIQQFAIQVPYRTLSSEYSLGIKGINTFGKEFVFRSTKDYDLVKSNYSAIDIWYSRAWWKTDRLFMTALLSLNKAERENDNYRQAFDNSGFFLINVASISQEYDIVKNINSFQIEDINTGGYGSVSIGKIFPTSSGGDNLYYISGYAEKSFLNDNYYILLGAGGASGFSQYSAPKYTYQESLINYYLRITNNLLLTGRMNQQAVWNWSAWRQLILDSDNGLRGYDLNSLQGENRVFVNTELRYFIDFEMLYFKPSLVAFIDIGSVWNQSKQIYDAIFRKTAGLGFRFHFMKSMNPNHSWRVDFPYNFETKQVGIVFTVSQFFSSFKNHAFYIPNLFGRILDTE